MCEELEDELGEGVVHGNLGMANEILCNLEEAQEHYKKVCSNMLASYIVACSSPFILWLFSFQQLDLMKSQNNLYGEAMALDGIARTYEYMANITKACETLEMVSTPLCCWVRI